VLGAEEVVQFSTEPAVLADGLRLANHFHALSLGLTRASVAAGAAWLLTSIAHEVQNSSELNPDGMNRVRVAKWLLAIVEVQLEAIERMGLPGLDTIEELIGMKEISASAVIGAAEESADAA
jgi:hypothetical protein